MLSVGIFAIAESTAGRDCQSTGPHNNNRKRLRANKLALSLPKRAVQTFVSFRQDLHTCTVSFRQD